MRRAAGVATPTHCVRMEGLQSQGPTGGLKEGAGRGEGGGGKREGAPAERGGRSRRATVPSRRPLPCPRRGELLQLLAGQRRLRALLPGGGGRAPLQLRAGLQAGGRPPAVRAHG